MAPALFDRSEYPTLDDVVYLNQASLGLIGNPAFEAMHDFLDGVVRHGNAYLTDEEEAGFLHGLRTQVARLFSTPEAQIAVVSGASELLGQAPFLLSPQQGSQVVLVESDFPAITRPWLRLADRGECSVVFVGDEPGSDLTDVVIESIGEDSAVVAVGSVQYATGTVIDVPRLSEATRNAGSKLVIDVSQQAGAMKFDAGTWGADIVVCSGYKWLGGAGGVGIGALSVETASSTPALPGWMGSADPFAFDATRVSYAEDARRFTQSTMSYVTVAGLVAAIDGLLGVGLDAVEAHSRSLRRMLLDGALARGWEPYRGLDDPAAAPHIVSLARAGGGLELAHELRESGIVCSARGGRIRVSLAGYNDEGDVEHLLDALD
jgi:cysteine desulfurase/selenocysteine lyase